MSLYIRIIQSEKTPRRDVCEEYSRRKYRKGWLAAGSTTGAILWGILWGILWRIFQEEISERMVSSGVNNQSGLRRVRRQTARQGRGVHSPRPAWDEPFQQLQQQGQRRQQLHRCSKSWWRVHSSWLASNAIVRGSHLCSYNSTGGYH